LPVKELQPRRAFVEAAASEGISAQVHRQFIDAKDGGTGRIGARAEYFAGSPFQLLHGLPVRFIGWPSVEEEANPTVEVTDANYPAEELEDFAAIPSQRDELFLHLVEEDGRPGHRRLPSARACATAAATQSIPRLCRSTAAVGIVPERA
jgi:hypothetical protein